MISMIVNNGIWPWLFDHNDDIGVFLRIGGHDLIRWYAVCILTGAILCLFRCKRELKRRGMPEDYYDNLFLSVIPISIIGARIWYVISEPEQFNRGSFIKTIGAMIGFDGGTFSLAGLAIQGGVLFGLAWGIIYFKFIKKRYPIGLHLDLAVPSIFIGQILGRWGNFFNGEVYGITVERSKLSWWIPKFVIDYCTGTGPLSQVGQDNVAIPLFYVESLLNIIGYVLIGVVIWRFWKGKFRKPFQVCCLYFIWYGTVRICLEPLRNQEYIMTRNIFGLDIRTSILMSALFIIGGVIAFIIFEIVYWKTPFEKIYVNEAAEEVERQIKEKHDMELQAKIDAKKAEIRARKAKEASESNE